MTNATELIKAETAEDVVRVIRTGQAEDRSRFDAEYKALPKETLDRVFRLLRDKAQSLGHEEFTKWLTNSNRGA